jgi:asparagine synthase (glutamine-hydrolysing)
MTGICGWIDPDPARRARTRDAIVAHMTARSTQKLRTWSEGTLTIVVSASESMPLDQASDAGVWSWVAGTLYAAGVSPARHVVRTIARNGAGAANGLNGYYAACSIDDAGTVSLAADALGLFPLYYASTSEILAFASEPGLLRRLPLTFELSLEGLAGILLQGHLANDQTLWRSVRRTAAGSIVCWRPGRDAWTEVHNAITVSDVHFDLEYPQARRLFCDTFRQSIARASRDQQTVGLMLSGGLDSRLIAAYLAHERPGCTYAFVFGDAGDNEVRCASRVARALAMPLQLLPIRFDRFGPTAGECVAAEQVSNTLWDYSWASGAAALSGETPSLMSGLNGDAVMGASALPFGYDAKRGEYSFAQYFAADQQPYGFQPDMIGDLVSSPDMARAVEQVMTAMTCHYDRLPGHEYQKVWLWSLINRSRYHVAAFAWRLSSAAWPLMPYTDRAMLDVAAGMPLAYVNNRRIQIDTLKEDFPALARLPVDRNTLDCPPLVDSIGEKLRRRTVDRVARAVSKPRERRTYYRAFDINNDGWRAVRRLAEAHRRFAERAFTRRGLARWILSPDEVISVGDDIIDTASRKTLLALMIAFGQQEGHH